MRQWLMTIGLLLVAGGLCGAPIKPVMIDNMSLGLNTVSSESNTVPGEASACHNLLLDEEDGAIRKRQGYDEMFEVYGLDSFLHNGIYTYVQQDGTRHLILVGDSDGVDYGNVYASLPNTVDFNSMDSLTIPCDIQMLRDTCKKYSLAGMHSFIEIIVPPGKWGINQDTCTIDPYIDSTWTAAVTADTFVVLLNASTCGDYITASRSGDNLIIAEDSTGHLIDFTIPGGGAWNPYTLSGATSAGNRIATKFPVQEAPRFATYDNKLYITSSVGKGVVWDGRRAHSFPLRAPGELGVAPLSTSGNLKGRYRYAVKLAAPSDSVGVGKDTVRTNELSYLTTPVIVSDGQVLLYDFPRMTRDSMHAHLDTYDSATYEVWRTTGDVGVLDMLDTIWNTGLTIHIDSGAWLTTTVTDTIGDDSLRNQSEKQIIADEEFCPIWLSDSLGGYFKEFSKPGAPGWIACDSAEGDFGIWQHAGDNDSVTWQEVAGWSVVVVPVDTIGKNVGDTGRSWSMYQLQSPTSYITECAYCGTADSVALAFARSRTSKITLALPEYSGDGEVLYWVYRGPIVSVKHDTTHFERCRTVYINGVPVTACNTRKETYHIGREFVVDGYYLLGTYSPGDTLIDSLPYDSLRNRAPYRRNATPQIIGPMVAFDNRLICSDGSELFVSSPSDSGLTYEALNRWSINRDDGDAITAIWPQKAALKAAKNKSVYSFYQSNTDPPVWKHYELAANYGCVAPLSHEATPEGDIFLSDDGVRIETEGIYKNRSMIATLLSKQLSAFRDMDIITKRGAISTYFDRKYMLSFPSVDSTWVMSLVDPPRGDPYYAWGTWDLVFSGATKYRVATDLKVTPADTLYFIKPGGSKVYRYKTLPVDVDQPVEWLWHSVPLQREDGRLYEVEDVVLEVESTDTVAANPIKFAMYDEKDEYVGDIYNLSNPDTSRYFSYKITPMASSRKWTILLWGSSPIPYGMDPQDVQNDVTVHGLRVNLVQRGFPIFK